MGGREGGWGWPRWLSLMHIRSDQEIVGMTPAGPAKFFPGDYEIFYHCHSLPSPVSCKGSQLSHCIKAKT